jgi:hypothetical protein
MSSATPGKAPPRGPKALRSQPSSLPPGPSQKVSFAFPQQPQEPKPFGLDNKPPPTGPKARSTTNGVGNGNGNGFGYNHANGQGLWGSAGESSRQPYTRFNGSGSGYTNQQSTYPVTPISNPTRLVSSAVSRSSGNRTVPSIKGKEPDPNYLQKFLPTDERSRAPISISIPSFSTPNSHGRAHIISPQVNGSFDSSSRPPTPPPPDDEPPPPPRSTSSSPV